MDSAEAAPGSIAGNKALIVMVLYVFSVFAVLMGLIGLFAGCKENRTCTFVTACCVTPTWFLFVLMGVILLLSGNTSSFGMNAICSSVQQELRTQYECAYDLKEKAVCDAAEVQEEERQAKLKKFQQDAAEETVDQMTIIDRELGPVSNLFMCSSKCPCANTDKKSDWTSLENDVLIRRYGRDRTKIPFKFNSSDKGVNTFRQCVEKIAEGSETDTFAKRARRITQLKGYKQAADFLQFLESEFMCTGFCVPTLFHFDVPIARGIPAKQACMPKFSGTIGDSLWEVGLASLLAGMVMSCLFCWQYCLWKKYD